MDLNDPKPVLPTPIIASDQHTFNNPCRQNFPFSWPIIKYILQNPIGKVWKKLIQTCKYFFAKYSVYPVEKLTNYKFVWNADGEIIDLTTKRLPKLFLFNTFACFYNYYDPDAFSIIMDKIVKCDLRILDIGNQALTWEDYQNLTCSGSLKEVFFFNCRIKGFDKTDVTFEKLLENLQKVERFGIYCKSGSKMFEKDTVKNMTKILSGFKKLRNFSLSNFDETFELSSFMDFLMTNKTVDVFLKHDDDVPFSKNFKQMLEMCFEKLIANPPEKIPEIIIYGFDGIHYLEYKKSYNTF